MANNSSNKVKVTGYAKRTFFNSGIEYRDFSDNLVGLQLASDGGTPLFTMGNFSITTNLSPKKNKIYNQGTYSFFYTLENLGTLIDSINIQKTEKAGLNLDITDPLSYVWYGSSSELIRTSVEYLKNQFPAAIYVDNKVGSITGNNITNYSYDSIKDESTFTVNSKYFINQFGIKYTKDSAITGTEIEDNPLRNLTNQYKYYTIEHSGITKDIIGFSGSVQTTNSDVVITVKGNPFPEITGLNFSQYSFLNPTYDGSIPYFIKPNVTKQEEFFASLNNLETNLLSKGTLPIYTSTFSVPEITDEGVIVHTQKILTFPVLSDGYNLNFFDGLYITYLDEITKIGEDLDESKTDIIKRKFVADVITGFDTIPRGDGDNLVLDGAKATKLIRIYGVSFDEVKKYINGIKFAHVITYGKKDNTPDSLVKDLADMLGLYTQFGSTRQGRIITPFLSNLNLEQIDIVLFRRLILNVAWLWKSKGARKAIEFLFRFIGAPELLVTFDEHIVIADKPLDIAKIKKLLYLYTGSSDISNLPFDKDGYPLPLPDGYLVITDFIAGPDFQTGVTASTLGIVENKYTEMYFQKAGGWYRQTGGDNSQIDINTGNNPHVGPYDGGSLYLQQFTKCPLPDFNESIAINVTGTTLYENHFLNYNHGFVNGTSPDSDIFITALEGTNSQFIEDCVDVTISIVNAPKLSGGTSVYELLCIEAIEEYELWLELIKEDCELIYSPEWYNVKNNYQVATSNYSQELVTAQCNENQSLEVCINFKDLEVIENPCDKYEVQFLDNGFIVFLDENGHKITFDEFPQCCVAAGGEYFSYITEDSNCISCSQQIVYFCAYETPCIGTPTGELEDGYVIWEITGGNTIPDTFYCIITQQTQQVSEAEWDKPGVNGCQNHIGDYNDSSAIQTFINDNTYQNSYNSPAIEDLLKNCFSYIARSCAEEVTETTVISSIPCCVYHGYNYTITTQEDGTQIIVCIPRTPSVAGSIDSTIASTQTINLPLTKGYSEYVPDSNLNATPTNDATIATHNTEGVYVIATANPTTNVSTDYDTYAEDPDLGDCDKWQVTEIDQYGRITFKSIDSVKVTETLDWTSIRESGGNQYKTCCIAKGYDYAEFVINKVTKSLMLSGLNSTGEFDNQTTGPSRTYACIDKNYIHCDDIKDLKLILGSTGFDGFYLPQTEEEGCDCEVNIRFDYMLKYDPAALIACSENCGGCECTTEGVGKNTGIRKSLATEQGESLSAQAALGSTSIFNTSDTTTNSSGPRTNTGNFINTIPCIPTIFHDQTLESILCPDFITFVSSEEESNLLLDNFDDADDIKIWEEDVTQLDPPVECCEALGGTVQSLYGKEGGGHFFQYFFPKWAGVLDNFEDHQANGDISIFPSGIDPSIISNIVEHNILLNQIADINTDGCTGFLQEGPFAVSCDNSIFEITYSELDGSPQLDWSKFNYITTQNICSLIPPSDCMHWSVLLFRSRVSLNQAEAIKVLLEDCISGGKGVSDIDRNMITTQVKIFETKFTNKKLIDDANNKILKQQKSITNIDTELSNITKQNIAINTVDSTVTEQIQCSVYQNKIDIINGYNVEESCKSNITEGTPEQVSTNYDDCIKGKNSELSQLKIIYEQLSEQCRIANESSKLIDDSKFKGNTIKEELYTTQYDNALSRIDELENSLISSEATLITEQLNNVDGNVDIVANILDVKPSTIRKGTRLTLTDEQKIILESTGIRNNIRNNELNNEKLEAEKEISKLSEDKKKITSEINLKLSDLETVLKDIKTSKGEDYKSFASSPCCVSNLGHINIIIQDLSQLISNVETSAQECYDEWGVTIQSGYDNFIDNGCGTYLSFIDDLKIKFTLEVDNNVIGTIPPSLIHYNLTTLPLTDNINPIWEFIPQNYSGVIIEGDEYDEVTVKNQIIQELISSGFTGLTNIFEPQWQTLDFNLSTSVCELLKQCYPDKQFFIGIEIENYECNVCLLIDNIQVNFNECDIVTKITTESCPMPELKCVIDNRKSWVYSDKGIQYVNSINDGSCIDVEINCEEIAGVHSAYSAILKTAQNRLWQNLEYRYTEYDFDHSDLIINTKSAAFKIDPAKSIECDVYNFWKNIDCDNCPTSCDLSCYILTEGDLYIATESGCTLLVWCDTVGDFIEYNGVVRSATTASLSSYTLTLTGSCDNLDFSCETYTTLLENKVTELKDEYYTLTADYNASLNATYAELKELGGDLTNFGITKNNCGSDTIIVGNYKDVNELFGLITEDIDGTLSLFEIYVYNSTTPYTGGTETEILSGYTAQTFDYSTDITAECCKSLNSLLNDTGKYGMGLGKNYVWSETFSACTWRDLDNCQGDCSYTGPTTINNLTPCIEVVTGYTCTPSNCDSTATTVYFAGGYNGVSAPYTAFVGKSSGSVDNFTDISISHTLPGAVNSIKILKEGNKDDIIAVGDNELVYWSDNGGQSWTQSNITFSAGVQDMNIVVSDRDDTGLKVWTMGDAGIIYYSSDAGKNFIQQTVVPVTGGIPLIDSAGLDLHLGKDTGNLYALTTGGSGAAFSGMTFLASTTNPTSLSPTWTILNGGVPFSSSTSPLEIVSRVVEESATDLVTLHFVSDTTSLPYSVNSGETGTRLSSDGGATFDAITATSFLEQPLGLQNRYNLYSWGQGGEVKYLNDIGPPLVWDAQRPFILDTPEVNDITFISSSDGYALEVTSGATPNSWLLYSSEHHIIPFTTTKQLLISGTTSGWTYDIGLGHGFSMDAVTYSNNIANTGTTYTVNCIEYQFCGKELISGTSIEVIPATILSPISGCTSESLIFDETNDPDEIFSNWTRFCFLARWRMTRPRGEYDIALSGCNPPADAFLFTGVNPLTGEISNDAGTYFERGVAWDYGDHFLPMNDGDNTGPFPATNYGLYACGSTPANNIYGYYYNTATEKYVISLPWPGFVINPSDMSWCTFDPREDRGKFLGDPTSTTNLTTSSNWGLKPLTSNQYTISGASNTVVTASNKATFPTMIECLRNSYLGNGFYSVCNFNDYTHEVTIGSRQSHPDNIGIVIAATKDVYGDYGPAGVTHSLLLEFPKSSTGLITVTYNHFNDSYGFNDFATGGTSYNTIVLSSSLSPYQSDNYDVQGNVRVKIVKSGSTVTISTTETMGDTGGTQTKATVNVGDSNPYLAPIFTFDLLDKNTWLNKPSYAIGDELEKFVTDTKIGYYTFSQPLSQFFDMAFDGEQELKSLCTCPSGYTLSGACDTIDPPVCVRTGSTITCCDAIGNDIISDPDEFNSWINDNYDTSAFTECFTKTLNCGELINDNCKPIYNICGKCYIFKGASTITGTTKKGELSISFSTNCCDVIGEKIISDPYEFNNWMINNYCTSEFNGCFCQVTCCDTEEVDICVKPLDFLDIPPSKVQVKQVFDEMVRMNLIDATNRQTISDYPTLRLFYHLYLVANDCGSELTGKLTYNNLFQFMDLIGDYWLELLEQVIPATTIMEGCDNSGKAYRNTIFDNNKFVYKKYVLNYNKCCPTKVSDNAIGCEDVDIIVEELCLYGDCMGQELEACNAELNAIKDKLESIQEEIIRITNLLHLPEGDGDIPCVLTEEEINNLNIQLISYQQQDIQINNEISNKQAECNFIQTNLQIQIATMNAQIANCDTFSDQIQQAEEELLLLEVGTFSYNSKVNYISELTEKYEKCVRLASTNVTNYDTVFITQMYNTNEYEGNVTVYGDDEWNESQQLIRDNACEEYMYTQPYYCTRGCRFVVDSCPDDTHDLPPGSGWSDLGFFDCDCTGTTSSTVATYSAFTGPILQPSAGDIQTYNYGFNIPAGSAILGIRVSIRRKQEFDDRWIFSDHSVQLTYGGQPIGDPNTTTQGTPWGTNWEAIYYGSYYDLWGHPWTVDEINDSTFGVRYLPQIDGTIGISNTGWLDCIEVRVIYYNNTNLAPG